MENFLLFFNSPINIAPKFCRIGMFTFLFGLGWWRVRRVHSHNVLSVISTPIVDQSFQNWQKCGKKCVSDSISRFLLSAALFVQAHLKQLFLATELHNIFRNNYQHIHEKSAPLTDSSILTFDNKQTLLDWEKGSLTVGILFLFFFTFIFLLHSLQKGRKNCNMKVLNCAKSKERLFLLVCRFALEHGESLTLCVLQRTLKSNGWKILQEMACFRVSSVVLLRLVWSLTLPLAAAR